MRAQISMISLCGISYDASDNAVDRLETFARPHGTAPGDGRDYWMGPCGRPRRGADARQPGAAGHHPCSGDYLPDFFFFSISGNWAFKASSFGRSWNTM